MLTMRQCCCWCCCCFIKYTFQEGGLISIRIFALGIWNAFFFWFKVTTGSISHRTSRLFEPMLKRSLLSKCELHMALLIKNFNDLEWIYHCLLLKTVMRMKHLPSTKFYLSLSAEIKHHNQYSSIIKNEQRPQCITNLIWFDLIYSAYLIKTIKTYKVKYIYCET